MSGAGFRLALKAAPPARVDMTGITPDRLAGLDAGAVARLTVFVGASAVALGDVFSLSGAPGAGLTLEGHDRLDNVGAGMAGGHLLAEGPVGALAGAGMVEGHLKILGNAGDDVGAGLAGGHIEIGGSTGARLAGALPGERRGMTGGTVRVAGDVGPQACVRLRGGLVLIAGSAGAGAAQRMIAGTMAVKGALGPEAGVGMKRGTLVLEQPPELLGVGFGDAGEHDLIFLSLLARRMPEVADLFGGSLSGRARRLVGDRLVGGQGEVLVLL
ncbi:formylmethanofuran dehydrogenase subunit C [Aquabacter sp. L1I39]|uniref:formylmethanofuran dehydrogenase subunit C n=1 Tax=Aquabacter sp. L1I39 TaxID=2820278 RepID=UPI001ADB05E5|nr:formylmethanofuran dehydrogenase subunit C [Aquabacter sp. L1I39]QTL02513.1 formylmethanofuran dehydrogenase subunit C [Aquabacter sp. L1I39]